MLMYNWIKNCIKIKPKQTILNLVIIKKHSFGICMVSEKTQKSYNSFKINKNDGIKPSSGGFGRNTHIETVSILHRCFIYANTSIEYLF